MQELAQLWQSYAAAHPKVKSSKLGLDELNAKLAGFVAQYSKRPLADFEELSSVLMLSMPTGHSVTLDHAIPREMD